MVIADINILCLEQKKRNYQLSNTCVKKYIRKKNEKKKIYGDRYHNLQKEVGTWYQLYPKARVMGDYNQEFFDVIAEEGEERIIFLKHMFKKEIISLLNDMIMHVPNRRLYFVVDLQGNDEKICALRFDIFVDKLLKGEICFNIVYQLYY